MERHAAMCSRLPTDCRLVLCATAAVLAMVLTMSQPVLGAARLHHHPSFAGAGCSNASSSLEYYVQVVVGSPYTGSVAAPLNINTTYNFGSVEVFDFNITEGASNSSKSLGHVRGFTFQTSYTATSHEVEVEVVSYDDGAGVNGTLSLQGLINEFTNEISIVGGSGSFRGARGYVVISLINPNLYHHSLYFL